MLPISNFSPADQDFLRRPAKPEPAGAKTAGAKPAGAKSRDWDRFRGPSGMGTSDATGLPVEWDQSHGLVWKTPLPGAGASSPISFGDRVYLTCYTGFFVPGESDGSPEQLQRHLTALRLDDGQVVWDKAVAAQLPEEEQELIVPVQGSVLAFAPDSGEPLWSCKTDIGWYMVPSVVAADGVVYCLGGRSGTAALAVRAGGSGDVTETHRLGTSVKGSNVSSPVYLDGLNQNPNSRAPRHA